MTAKEFYEELAKTARKWEIGKSGSIRQTELGTTLCPITSVCRLVTGEAHPISSTFRAAVELGLDDFFVARLIAAADYIDKVPIVRNKLLKAVGL